MCGVEKSFYKIRNENRAKVLPDWGGLSSFFRLFCKKMLDCKVGSYLKNRLWR